MSMAGIFVLINFNFNFFSLVLLALPLRLIAFCTLISPTKDFYCGGTPHIGIRE
jgi:hypothetical protein